MTTKTVLSDKKLVFQQANRINRSLTASVEKRALEWMAARAPAWLTSDQLTILGLAAQVGAGLCYAAVPVNRFALVVAILCLTINWFGDSMDGTLARVRRQQRPRYGFYVDHMVDLIGAVALMVGLGASGLLHWQMAASMLVAFLLLSGESYLATDTLSRFELSQGIFGPTEIRILLIFGNLAALRSPYSTIVGHRFLLFDIGGLVASIGMMLMALSVTARHTLLLYREEPLP